MDHWEGCSSPPRDMPHNSTCPAYQMWTPWRGGHYHSQCSAFDLPSPWCWHLELPNEQSPKVWSKAFPAKCSQQPQKVPPFAFWPPNVLCIKIPILTLPLSQFSGQQIKDEPWICGPWRCSKQSNDCNSFQSGPFGVFPTHQQCLGLKCVLVRALPLTGGAISANPFSSLSLSFPI